LKKRGGGGSDENSSGKAERNPESTPVKEKNGDAFLIEMGKWVTRKLDRKSKRKKRGNEKKGKFSKEGN